MVLGTIKIQQYAVQRLLDRDELMITLKDVETESIFKPVLDVLKDPYEIEIHIQEDWFIVQEMSINNILLAQYQLLVTQVHEFEIHGDKTCNLTITGKRLINDTEYQENYFTIEPVPIVVMPYKNSLGVIWNIPYPIEEIAERYTTYPVLATYTRPLINKLNTIRFVDRLYKLHRLASINSNVSVIPGITNTCSYFTTGLYYTGAVYSQEEMDVVTKLIIDKNILFSI